MGPYFSLAGRLFKQRQAVWESWYGNRQMKKGRGGLKHRLLFFKRERFLNFFYYSLNLYKAKILIFWRKTNLVYILLRVAKNSNLLVTHSHFTMSQWKKPYFWNGFCWAASLLFSFGLDPRCISDPELRDYLNADDWHLDEWELVSHYLQHPHLVPMSTMLKPRVQCRRDFVRASFISSFGHFFR